MKVNLYAIFDTASKVYDGPFPALTDEVAIRDFTNISMNKESKVGRNPEHFLLYRVGTWDDAVGECNSEGYEVLAKAIEVVANVVPIRQADSVEDAHGLVKESDIRSPGGTA